MRLLHISDLHFGSQSSFDQDLVQKTLIEYLDKTSDAFDGLVVTGDIAFSGRTAEYVMARKFFTPLIEVLGLSPGSIAICPGNHDVDRTRITGLARTLSSTEESDQYFAGEGDCVHILRGQEAFAKFYENLLERSFYAQDALAGPVILRGQNLSVELWELNTALFSRDDSDHGRLWVGRSSFAKVPSLPEHSEGGRTIRLLLGHHPLEWLASEEEARVQATVEENFTAYLRGHLHTGGYAAKSSTFGDLIQVSAGALYQGAQRPIEANIIEISDDCLKVRPFRYVDDPSPAWIPDNGKFGKQATTELTFPFPRAHSLVVKSPASALDATATFSHSNLFTNSENEPIFVEPRICGVPFGSVTPETREAREVSIEELITKYDELQIEVDTEHGATTLSHYIAHKMGAVLGLSAEVLSAESVPNYKAKLQKFVDSEVDRKTSVIILDGVYPSEHKKMVDAMRSLSRFAKIVAISSSPQFISLKDIGDGRKLFDSDVFYAWPVDRKRLRSLAVQVFSPKVEEDVAYAVDKTYVDLVSLAIPLTPSNIIMYLYILKNEGDFVPLDRVSIIQRYLTEALTRSSDQTASSFGVRDRLSLLASFTFDRFMLGKTSFSRREWNDFCRDFQERTFSDFSIESVLSQLLRSRVIVEYGSQCYVRYSFVYDFLVGLHAASSQDKLAAFLEEGHHRRLPRVVEVMAAIALDPAPLIRTLSDDLDRHLQQFQEKYVSKEFDPVELIEWKVDEDGEEEKFWDIIEKRMEEGPASSGAIDKVKESLLAESRSADQEVVIQDFSALEIDLFRSSKALNSALRVAVGLEGDLKLPALRSVLASELAVLQVGARFSKNLALSRSFRWGGVMFINDSYDPLKSDSDYGEIVPWVIFSLDLSICDSLCESLGTRRLGPTFHAVLQKAADLSEYEMFTLFALILRTKPRDWVSDLESIIERVPYRKWRQKSFVDLLMLNYKNEPNTVDSKASIRHLVALVEAKRASHKKLPGAKSVTKMQEHLEKTGRFNATADGE